MIPYLPPVIRKYQRKLHGVFSHSYSIYFVFITLIAWLGYDGNYRENTTIPIYKHPQQEYLCGSILAPLGYFKGKSCEPLEYEEEIDEHRCKPSICTDESKIADICHDDKYTPVKISRDKDCTGSNNTFKCCRVRKEHCTWQGTWASLDPFQRFRCTYEADDGCGALICAEKRLKISPNGSSICNIIDFNEEKGVTDCGIMSFSRNVFVKERDQTTKVVNRVI